ncbi:MAG: hypothetical protein QM529_04200 [Hydrotalea sp.]|nr:hypothetical protein [Hydrotalea sp.]
MRKTCKQLLLASAIIGISLAGTAQAQTGNGATPTPTTSVEKPAKKHVAEPDAKDGFYLAPNAEVIFVNKNFTRGLSTLGVGGGGGLSLGYKIKNFLIDFAVDYQSWGNDGTFAQTTTADGRQWLRALRAGQAFLDGYNNPDPALVKVLGESNARFNSGRQSVVTNFAVGTPDDAASDSQVSNNANGALQAQKDSINSIADAMTKGVSAARYGAYNTEGPPTGAEITTTIKSKEGFIPITLGLKYSIALAPKNIISLTPGLAGGVWLHTIDRTITMTTTGTTPWTTTDKATETRGVIVPSLSLDYNPLPNLSVSLAGKFYIVPGGYSDNYSASQRNVAAANTANDPGTAVSVSTDPRFDNNSLPLGLSPTHNAVKKSFWYGGLNLGVQYVF